LAVEYFLHSGPPPCPTKIQPRVCRVRTRKKRKTIKTILILIKPLEEDRMGARQPLQARQSIHISGIPLGCLRSEGKHRGGWIPGVLTLTIHGPLAGFSFVCKSVHNRA